MRDMIPLVEVHRGGLLESVHRGAVALVDGTRPLLLAGDVARNVYYRSTSKPIQALVAVTSGAVDARGVTDEELALAAGSHNAEPRQLEVATSILQKAGLGVSALGCGGHYSIDAKLAHRQRCEVPKDPPRLWSNCSGKHALMLLTAVHLGASTDDYLAPTHPVQQAIHGHVAVLAGLRVEEVPVGVDNCGTPAFALPLLPMAVSLARLAHPKDVPAPLADACRRVTQAMLAYPDMVGGRGRFDTDLMQTCPGALVAKAGAEGVHGWMVAGRGLAMAIKVEDGLDRGYRLVVLEALERLGLLDADQAAGLRKRQADPTIRTWRGGDIGRLTVALPPGEWPAV